MTGNKLKDYLDQQHVHYMSIPHTRSYTAQETAASAHISGKHVAKTVMVKLDGELTMAVLPAPLHLDLEQLKADTHAHSVTLVGEEQFQAVFPDCEVGAMPPFGNLYGQPVYVDESLAEDDQIVFNAGSHTELIQMAYRDYDRLVNPKVVNGMATA